MLGNAIRLRDDFGGESRLAFDELKRNEHVIAQSCAAIAKIDIQLAQLASPQMLLESAVDIESLQERLGAVEKAKLDRAQLVHLQSDSEHRSRRILRDLGRSIDLDAAETLRLRADEPTIIRKLGQQFAELRTQAEQARRTIARREDEIRRQREELAGLEKPRDVESLRRVARKGREAGDLDTRLVDAWSELDQLERKASIALAQLPGWRYPAEELERLAVPLEATLERYESAFLETSSHAKCFSSA